MTRLLNLAIHRATPLVLLLGAAIACGEDGSRQRVDASVVRRDSAGVAIIETPGPAARAPIGWSVSDRPELRLGSVAGEGPDQFHMIGGISGGIAQLPDGRIVVVDGGSAELRFFDGEGRFLDRAGGSGDGPGEFRRPWLVPYVSSDSLLIFDRRQRRFTLFSSDGQAHRNFPLQGLPRELLIGAARGAAESGILMTTALGTVTMGQEGQRSNPVGVRWISLESGRAEIVAEFQTLSYRTNEIAEVPYILAVPFSARPSAAMGPNGFFVTGGDAPEVREFDTTGRLVRIFRLAEAPRPVTPEDVESVIDFEATRFRDRASQARRVYEQMEFPDRWPFFQSVRVDRIGWIWAEVYHPPQDETSHWMIFEPSGTARGTIELPPDLEVHDIGVNYVLGRSQDELRVEYVHRYRLDRGG